MVKLSSNGEPVWGELVVAEPVDNVSAIDAVSQTIKDLFRDNAVRQLGISVSAIAILTQGFVM